MRDVRDRLLILSRINGLSRAELHYMRKVDPLLLSIFSMLPHEMEAFLHVTPHKAISIVRQLQQTEDIKKSIQYDQSLANIITIEDDSYPDTLRNIPDAPLVLYTIGNMQLLQDSLSLSVIGSRRPSREAKPKLDHIITPLIKAGYVIISGLAYGIDCLAHERTLLYNGKTIAVLGGGFRHIYPKANIPLCRKIAREGLILSEYAPSVRPEKHHFPERNRIISGLGRGTLVVEAMERSGTLITVDQALEQGKDVFAIPGSPLLRQTLGCNRIIQDGAKLVINANDIHNEWF